MDANRLLDDLPQWLERQLVASRGHMAACVSATGLSRVRSEFFQKVTPARGSIVAAADADPRSRPDYFFHWLRDSALVMAAFEALRRMNAMGDTPDPFPDFVRFSADLSRLDGRALVREGRIGRTNDPKLAKYLRSAHELAQARDDALRGESRFNADGTLDILVWARPQFDGPALRAMALLQRVDDVSGNAHERELLGGDLDYLARVSREPCFDLWEERFGHHYHTRLVALTALKRGEAWRLSRNELMSARAYARAANQLAGLLDTHWSAAEGHYLAAAKARGASPRDLDAAVILAIVQGRLSSGRHSPLDPRAQATLSKLEDHFAKSFEINRNRAPGLGVLFGRFPGDGYYGGGAFPFTSCAAAGFHYRLASALHGGGALTRAPENAGFLARCGVPPDGEPPAASAERMVRRGDAILAAMRRFVPEDGSLPEQFDKASGLPASAPDLAMSHATFILACAARRAAVG